MRHRQTWTACSISALCLLLAARHACAAFFVSLGLLSPEFYPPYSNATDVSADGSAVVGTGGTVGWYLFDIEAFRCTRDGGLIGLGNVPGTYNSAHQATVIAKHGTRTRRVPTGC